MSLRPLLKTFGCSIGHRPYVSAMDASSKRDSDAYHLRKPAPAAALPHTPDPAPAACGPYPTGDPLGVETRAVARCAEKHAFEHLKICSIVAAWERILKCDIIRWHSCGAAVRWTNRW